MAAYVPQSQREYALIHCAVIPQMPDLHQGPVPTTPRPTAPAYPDGLGSPEQAQVDAWRASLRDAAAYAAVTLAGAITKVDEFILYDAAERSWQITFETDRMSTWAGTYVDSLMRNHNAAVVPPTQTGDGVPINPQTSPVVRNTL